MELLEKKKFGWKSVQSACAFWHMPFASVRDVGEMGVGEMILVWLIIGMMIGITMMAAINVAVDRETEDREQEEWIKEWNTTQRTSDTKENSSKH